MEDNRVIELPNLTHKNLETMLLNCAEKYQSSYKKEVKKMTEIVDPKTTIKDAQTSLLELSRLTQAWQLETKFQKFDDKVLKVILRNCGGNPLYCQQYFVNLLHGKFIEIRA